MLGKDSKLAGPRGTTNPSNVQGLNNAQSEGNYEDPRMACVEKPTLGSSRAKGCPARTQILRRWARGSQSWAALLCPGHQDQTLPATRPASTGWQRSTADLSETVSLLIQAKIIFEHGGSLTRNVK